MKAPKKLSMVGHATWPHFLNHPKELGKIENEAYVFFSPLNLGKMGIEPMLFPKELDYTFCGVKFLRGKCLYLSANWPHFLGQVAQRRKNKLWQVLQGKEKECGFLMFFLGNLQMGPKFLEEHGSLWGTMFSQGT